MFANPAEEGSSDEGANKSNKKGGPKSPRSLGNSQQYDLVAGEGSSGSSSFLKSICCADDSKDQS